MTKTNIFIDKSFNAENISNYHLSLQIFLKGLSFCILDKGNNKFIALGHYYYEHIVSYNKVLELLDKIFEENDVLKLQFTHTKILFNTPKFTFIPSDFFSEDSKETIFKFNNELNKNEVLLQNYIFSNSSYVLFAIPNYIKEWINQKFPHASIYHQSVPFLEEILLNNKTTSEDETIYVNIHHSFCDISYIKNSELQLFNSFEIKSDTDFKYYLLNIYDNLKLSSKSVPVIFSGFIKTNDNRIEDTKQFIKKTGFLKKPQHFNYSFEFNSIEEHYFTNMLNLYQCG